MSPVAPLSQQAGFRCTVCDCVMKDSATYLDHINGKKHQRALGMSMRVERSTLEKVKKRFEFHKKRKEEAGSGLTLQEYENRISRQLEEEEETKRRRREEKKRRKKEMGMGDDQPEIDPEVAAMMGFGSSKK